MKKTCKTKNQEDSTRNRNKKGTAKKPMLGDPSRRL